jgi:hypothetical protein
MTAREKTLAAVVGGVLALIAGGFGLRAFLFKPLTEIDKKTAALREKIDKVKTDRRTYFADEERMKTIAQRMFSDDLDQASAR